MSHKASWLSAHRHTLLLVAIVAAFTIRPLIGNTIDATIPFSIVIMLLLVMALYTTQVDELVGDRARLLVQRRRRRILGWALVIPAVAERIYSIFSPTYEAALVSSISWLVFFVFVTLSLLRTLLAHRDITNETIALSVSIYLLLGLSWAMLYITIYQFHPDAFSLGSSPATPPDGVVAQSETFPTFIYFSLTTISTMGFGDILPLTLQARFAAVAEGITGQFYLAILVARLVGMQMSAPAKPVSRDE